MGIAIGVKLERTNAFVIKKWLQMHLCAVMENREAYLFSHVQPKLIPVPHAAHVMKCIGKRTT
jgi:hypothetical protein